MSRVHRLGIFALRTSVTQRHQASQHLNGIVWHLDDAVFIRTFALLFVGLTGSLLSCDLPFFAQSSQNSKGEVKLSDFGISKALDSSTAMSNTTVGTYRYMSPERLLGQKYDSSEDIWSVGITIVQLWLKKYPLEDASDNSFNLLSALQDGFAAAAVSARTFSPSMREFILSTLRENPNDRATCEDLRRSEWFSENGISTPDEASSVRRKNHSGRDYMMMTMMM